MAEACCSKLNVVPAAVTERPVCPLRCERFTYFGDVSMKNGEYGEVIAGN